MKDPFFIQPWPFLSDATRPAAEYLGLPTLPLHVHEVVVACLFYSVIYFPLSPLICGRLFPQYSLTLSAKERLEWNARVVSLVQSSFINVTALWVIYSDEQRGQMDWQQRIWGYTGAAGMVQGFAAGYFLWDLVVTSLHLDVFGPGALAHAVCALLVYSLGFRPFVNYYSPIFILWELSTPFLNFNWFMYKNGMKGTRLQLYNGLALLFTFFLCRLAWGTYQSSRLVCDVWASINTSPAFDEDGLLDPTMLFISEYSTVSLRFAASVIISNITLNLLNFYWFYRMIGVVKKRLYPSGGTGRTPGDAKGKSTDISTVDKQIHRRRP